MTAVSVPGRLISIEGGEGAGKSTAIAAVTGVLERHGRSVVSAREPGGTAFGEACRHLLLDTALTPCAESELLLMFASRAQLVRERIRPALARGEWVVCDRFTDASFAYQGGGRGLGAARVAELERWAVGLRPDLTILLDIGVEHGLARMRGRGEPDRIERERTEFFERVRTSYLDRAAREPARFRVIDAALPVESVTAQVVACLEAWLLERAQAEAGHPESACEARS
ncbi:MAG TPA: dTMP kinase [Xanthomonadales bacterium]|nr:dTMP kinase [Xanthomonadales bacterium]